MNLNRKMKTIGKIALMLTLTFTASAQQPQQQAVNSSVQSTSSKPLVGIVSLESKGISLDADQLGNLIRIEMEKKQDQYRVIDKYDTKELMEKNMISSTNCFGKTCLVNTGKILQADKMISGSVEKYGERIIVTLRMVDVQLASIEKTQVNEFLNFQAEVQAMLQVTLNNMLGGANDPLLVERLSKPATYETTVTNPGVQKVNLSGPRMGLISVFGDAQDRFTDPRSKGGYDALPVMTQFGYQFETQYLNEGNFQALVEFMPLVSGIDQGLFIPSITLMNGFRNSINGWEVAFGPTFTTIKMAEGYYTADKEWHMRSEWPSVDSGPTPVFVRRMDSRGDLAIGSAFVIAVGKTFKSGKLNIPVNGYVIPTKESVRVGFSFGFNNKRTK